MFPNIRLMCVGVLATIVSTSCALGLFAELRISQGLFKQQSNVGASLQLASTAPVPSGLDVAMQQSIPAVDAVLKPQIMDNTGSLDRPAPALLAAKSLAAPASVPEPESTITPQAPSVSVSDAGRPPTSGSFTPSSQTPVFTVPVQQTMAESKIVPAKPRLLASSKPSGHRGGRVRHFREARPALPVQTFIPPQPPYQWLTPPTNTEPAVPAARRSSRRRPAATKPAAQIWSPQETILSTVGTPPE
jgi:hypothetical protein